MKDTVQGDKKHVLSVQVCVCVAAVYGVEERGGRRVGLSAKPEAGKTDLER